MNGRAWAASLVLHSAIVALLVSFAGADLSLRRPERWEVQLAFAAPLKPLAAPAPPATATEAPVHPPLPPTVASAARHDPALSAQRPQLPPVVAVKPPPKRATPPQIKQPPRPLPEKPVATPRKLSPSPPAVAAKTTPRSSQQKAVSPFSETPSPPTPQEFLDSPRTAFAEMGATSPRRQVEMGRRAGRSPARDAAPPAKPDPKPAADWHAALRAKLRDMRVYPSVARRLGQEGTVMLVLEIGANGDLRGLAVRQSSGHAVLDQAAQQLARNAVAALRGQLSPPGESRLEIPVAYRLDR